MGLKTKLILLISLVVMMAVVIISAIDVGNLTQQILADMDSRGQSTAEQIFEQAHDVLAGLHMPPGMDSRDPRQLRDFVQNRLASDSGLNTLLQSCVGSSPQIYYVTITDMHHTIMVHNDPGEIGLNLAPAAPFSELLRAGFLRQLRMLYGSRHRMYEVDLPLQMGGNAAGDVRVGLSAFFIPDRLNPALIRAGIFSLLLVALATISVGLLSYGMLRPLETISRGVERWAHGEYNESIRVDRRDEWGALSSKLNLLGEQMRGEKAAFVALKDNLDQLLASLTDGLMLFDAEGRLLLATPAAARLLGRPTQGLQHRPAADVFSGSSALDEVLRDAFRDRQRLSDCAIEMRNGGQTDHLAVSTEFLEEGGTSIGSVVTLRDSSTRARLETQIDITAKIAALGKIMSGVAHEVKNPLNAMVLQLEVLKAKLGEEQESVAPQLKVLADELRRLDRVVKTFLDFTRPVELRRSETDIENLVREVFILAEPHARQNKVHLHLEPNGTLPRLPLDSDLIKQALLNLVLNGCQAMPSGGSLTVAPRAFDDHVDVEVRDEGVGIPLEAQPKIFSLFFTTKSGGTGVGLAMAFRIVQMHNGSMDFSSEPGHGTTFRVSLPR